MGMNRQKRRALKARGRKSGLKGGQKFIQAGDQLDEALDALKGLEGIEGAVKNIEAVRDLVNEAGILMNALVDDYQALSDELATQKEVLLRVLACLGNDNTNALDYQALAFLKELEKSLRRQYDAERAAGNHTGHPSHPG